MLRSAKSPDFEANFEAPIINEKVLYLKQKAKKWKVSQNTMNIER